MACTVFVPASAAPAGAAPRLNATAISASGTRLPHAAIPHWRLAALRLEVAVRTDDPEMFADTFQSLRWQLGLIVLFEKLRQPRGEHVRVPSLKSRPEYLVPLCSQADEAVRILARDALEFFVLAD